MEYTIAIILFVTAPVILALLIGGWLENHCGFLKLFKHKWEHVGLGCTVCSKCKKFESWR